jgi:hypothetical protein
MNTYSVSVSLVFPVEGSEVYNERFTMTGDSAESVTKRVRLMLADSRYLVAVRKA